MDTKKQKDEAIELAIAQIEKNFGKDFSALVCYLQSVCTWGEHFEEGTLVVTNTELVTY